MSEGDGSGGSGHVTFPLTFVKFRWFYDVSPTVALAAPVKDQHQRLGWSCAVLPAVSERLRHVLHHVPNSRWDVPAGILAVGIALPATKINAALAAEGLSVNLTETALIAVPLYTVTASDRARTLEVCRSTYAVAA